VVLAEAKASLGKDNNDQEYENIYAKRKRRGVDDKGQLEIYYRYLEGVNNAVKQNIKMGFFFDLH
jgi:hypothetical protein